MSSQDKLLVFDLGKVIFDYDLNKISNTLLKFSTKEFLFDDMDSFIYSNRNLFYAYEKGLISTEHFYKDFMALLSIDSLSLDQFINIWNEIFFPMQDTIDLIRKLSKNNELALLSNTNDLHFNYIYNRFKNFFDNNFKYLHLSYKMNMRKPDKEIYSAVIDFHKINPQNIFFTDDNESNIISANEVGLKAYVFKDIKNLIKDLQEFGIEV